nr:sulfite exporter TauE/SafE family protein [Conexibacter arvalis]
MLEALLVLAAGVGAGTINTVVGSGTLITFPVLLGVGYSPITANVSNALGLVPGSLSGTWGYRRELAGQRARIVRYGTFSFLGAATGAALLFVLPSEAFDAIVPVMVAIALVLVVLQPWLSRRLADRRDADAPPREGGPATRALGYLTGVYGGYFGAAQGILLLAIFGVALDDDLQRVNALKNVLATIVNIVAGLIFLFVADVAWEAVALIAVGSAVGGQVGAKVGRRLPPNALRAVIVCVGLVAIAQLLGR